MKPNPLKRCPICGFASNYMTLCPNCGDILSLRPTPTMKPNALQRHAASQPITDPYPEQHRRLTMGEILLIDRHRRNVRKNGFRRAVGRFLAKCGGFWR